jgi:hypothetical protein
MSDILVKIKRAIFSGKYEFSEKARLGMEHDGLTELDIVESISNAVAIYKKIRSTMPSDVHKREYLYIIQSPNLNGEPIYTKGKFVTEHGMEVFYFLISSKYCL